jgi:hypothetical protein
VLTTTEGQTARTESEVVFVTDVSLSMLASTRAGAPTRLDRERAVVRRLRTAVPDVPAGLSGLTDRALPYIFPTLDEGVFEDALKRSVLIDAPQPQGFGSGGLATNFQPLGFLTRNGFFSAGARHRTCVVVTDGETRAVLPGPGGCTLIVIGVGGPGDRIFAPNGTVDPDYRPESSAASTLDRLARAAGGASYTETDLSSAAARLRKAAELGPRSEVGTGTTVHALSPYLAALALTVVAVVLLRKCRRRPSPTVTPGPAPTPL